MDLSVREVTAIVGGILLCGDGEIRLRHVSFDSRNMLGDDLFVPTIGARVDGHDYIENAFENGAVATLTARRGKVTGARPHIFVQDTQKALEALGKHFRSLYKGRVIGITGSVGKTTTREMTKAALSAGGSVTGSMKNMNSQIGTPVVLCHMDQNADRAVMEMGISDPGEMLELVDLVHPQVALVTNIGVAHLEQLGSREGICREKMHICDGLGPEDTVILNGEEPLLVPYKDQLSCRVLYYGLHPERDVYAKDIRDEDPVRFTAVFRVPAGGQLEVPVTLSVPGIHNVMNALAALTVAWAEGIKPEKAARALEGFGGFSRRLERMNLGGLKVIDDSYNAGPPSMKAALQVLAKAKEGRRIALLADMLELGEDEALLHRQLGEFARDLKIELFITLGSLVRNLEEPLVQARRPVFHCDTPEQAAERVIRLARKGDTVLLKGSNSMRLDKVLEAIKVSEKFKE